LLYIVLYFDIEPAFTWVATTALEALDARFEAHVSPRDIQEGRLGTYLNCGIEEFNPDALQRS
jgi:hypothetical protein